MIEPLVRNALVEDLGLAGDITSAAVIPVHRTSLQMASRQSGVIAGLDLAVLAFELIDPAVTVTRHIQDGDHVLPGAVIATIEGRSQALLTAERTALNFISHLSGIATLTARWWQRSTEAARASPAPARRRPACGRSRNMRCAPAAA
jgi:nicotinate-nucleotide pyrophosphorylase (carboxylating)